MTRLPGSTQVFMLLLLSLFSQAQPVVIQTVNGVIKSGKAGFALSHEHILVDFIGAQLYLRERWNEDEVVAKVKPYLLDIKRQGIQTFYDCTPQYLGRDADLLARLSRETGLNIVTNTGYYGGSDHKYLPAVVFTATAEQLAEQWITEFEQGIDGTVVKPGIIKISVNPGALSEVSKKLITAAALTHRATGLTIASHTGPALPALEQLDILQQQGIAPSAFIWVHAQNANDTDAYLRAARRGCWISLDCAAADNLTWYVSQLHALHKARVLDHVLVSHDAGWYDPAQPGGGNFRAFTTIKNDLIPALKKAGFSSRAIRQLFMVNPAKAFAINKRLMS